MRGVALQTAFVSARHVRVVSLASIAAPGIASQASCGAESADTGDWIAVGQHRAGQLAETRVAAAEEGHRASLEADAGLQVCVVHDRVLRARSDTLVPI